LLIPLVAQVTHSNDDASLWPKLASTNTTGDAIWHGFEAPIYNGHQELVQGLDSSVWLAISKVTSHRI
jgi:hypothetical protein